MPGIRQRTLTTCALPSRLQPPITDRVVKLFNFYLNYTRGDASDIVSCNDGVGCRRKVSYSEHVVWSVESLNVEPEEISPWLGDHVDTHDRDR
jgi:hypothetical protein